MTADKEEADYMDNEHQGPAYRVGKIQHHGALVCLEYGGHPAQPKPAYAHHGDQGRGDGVPHAPHAAYHYVHHAADEVDQADVFHPHQAGRDHRRVGRIDAQQPGPGQIGGNAQHQAGGQHQALAFQQYLVYPVRFAGADVLAGKGEAGLVEGVHGGIYKALNVGRSRVARHDGGTEAVHRGLDHHVGYREHDTLQPGRQADLENQIELEFVDFQLFQVQLEAVGFPQHAAHHQSGRDGLADGGGNAHACHPQVAADDQKQVENHVHDAGQQKEIQGPLGIALGS